MKKYGYTNVSKDIHDLTTYLHTVVVNEVGEYVAYCGSWYNSTADYAYVETVYPSKIS